MKKESKFTCPECDKELKDTDQIFTNSQGYKAFCTKEHLIDVISEEADSYSGSDMEEQYMAYQLENSISPENIEKMTLAKFKQMRQERYGY